MKQAILTFDRCRVLLVELPDNTVSVEPSYCHAIIWKDNTGYIETEYPLGEDSPCIIEPVGKLSELTEEQFAEIVDKDRSGYKDYDEEGICSIYPFIGAKGSFLSKLRADGYITEMPEIKEDPSDFGPGWNLGYGGFPQRIVEEIDAANARLFHPDRTYLFKIVKQ